VLLIKQGQGACGGMHKDAINLLSYTDNICFNYIIKHKVRGVTLGEATREKRQRGRFTQLRGSTWSFWWDFSVTLAAMPVIAVAFWRRQGQKASLRYQVKGQFDA
jgi:hypothetical protein